MFQINTGQARTDLFKKGLGGAHEWDFDTLDKAVQQNAQRRQQEQLARQKADADRMEAINKQVANLGDEVFARDLPKFLEKQENIKKYTLENVEALKKGDAKATSDLNAMLNEFHATAKASNEVGKNWIATKKFVETKGRDGYYPDSIAKLDAFGSPDNAMNFDIGSVQPEEMHDIDADIDTRILPELLHTKKGQEFSSPDYGKGEQISTRKFVNTKDDAVKYLKETALSDPSWLRRGVYDLSRETPEIQAAYGDDVASYIADKKAHKITFNQSETKVTPLSDSASGPVEIEESTTENPLSYKINTISTKKSGEAVPATVDVAARATLKRPIKVVGATTEGIRTVDGNEELDQTDVVEVQFGEVNTVPVYKPGTKAIVNGKEKDLSGSVVPKEIFDLEKKKGVIEYTNMANGIAKVKEGEKRDLNGNMIPVYKNVSITKPAEELKGALEGAKVPLDKLNEKKDFMNQGLGSKVLTGTSKSGKAIYSEDGGKTWKYK